jgi:hypothetical protein
MNICNWCAVVGVNKLVYAKRLHGICIILRNRNLLHVLQIDSGTHSVYPMGTGVISDKEAGG